MRSTWTSRLIRGQSAPEFRGITQSGDEISSSKLLGKKYILFFYNHDGSETCTKEACNMRDHFDLLSDSGFTIFGVCEDSCGKHQRFISKYGLPYSLISDEKNVLAKLFDIYGSKEFMGRISDTVHRTTFVIDEEGIIQSVIHPVDSAHHAEQILESLNQN
ncbi:MAG TPA: peroxiredoxin [Saprospiraceae bacterium]|nr:peroxiredoxin [Saprospiraceae bacterium]